MKVLLILKIGRRKVKNFSEVTKFFHDENFPRHFITRQNMSLFINVFSKTISVVIDRGYKGNTVN